MYGFCTHLEDRLDKDDFAVVLPDKWHAKLCIELNNQYYTYLVISDGLCHEIVCVELENGFLVIDRGQDDTDRQAWPCGAAVKFDTVPSGFYDMVTAKDYKEDSLEEGCETRFTGSICNGNCTVHFEDGIATEETPNKKQIADGTYDRPVPTYQHGKLVALAEGTNTAFLDPGCCG